MVSLGIDVGFSKQVRSTGLCLLQPEAPQPITAIHVKTQETLPAIQQLLGTISPTAIGIDGPLVPTAKASRRKFITINHYRSCERLLTQGIFQRRCKPGPTNSPRGQALHRQATHLANNLAQRFPTAIIVEAFPNAYLGVMLPNSIFRNPIRRGIKSDVFWDKCLGNSSRFKTLLKFLFGATGDHILRHCCKLQDHDERAAFICALTAYGSHRSANLMIRGDCDGTISLPPTQFIQRWALSVLS